MKSNKGVVKLEFNKTLNKIMKLMLNFMCKSLQ